jgi:type VI secretion system protein ImpE
MPPHLRHLGVFNGDPMNDAAKSFDAGDLDGCLYQLQASLRQRPADTAARIFLAQLLLVLGQWQRASNQLNVLAEMDTTCEPLAHAYQPAIQCELFRASVFAGKTAPLIFGEPPEWIAPLVESLALSRQGKTAEALAQRAAAFGSASPTAGSLNGAPFETFWDMDSRLGPLFELFVEGRYFWVPVSRVQRLASQPPSNVRDMVWLPVQVTWSNGGQTVALMPSRYSGSESSTNASLRLARATEWLDLGEEQYQGFGQRMFATENGELGLFEIRELTLATASG